LIKNIKKLIEERSGKKTAKRNEVKLKKSTQLEETIKAFTQDEEKDWIIITEIKKAIKQY
jgi:hypothetical protein